METNDIIKSEAKEFYHYGSWKNKRYISNGQDLNEGLKRELMNHSNKSRVIYLNELLILLDLDAQEHLKQCKMKDNPDKCLTNQFYAKSKYYVNQHLEAYIEVEKSPVEQYELDHNLGTETLEDLDGLLKGNSLTLTKCSPQEIHEIIIKLNHCCPVKLKIR
ncbi:MAG TPA: hypothetical protein VK021_04500 [Flavobacteriaceae bacterium]|nr:hypothetical protein [Flavobacteriaceae bacterium]